jgi:ubiquitin C-terminal hydrolase
MRIITATILAVVSITLSGSGFAAGSPTPLVSTPKPLTKAVISGKPSLGPSDETSATYHMGRRGFTNLGNTCFANVGLQVLTHSSELRKLILPVAAAPLVEEGTPERINAVRVVNAFARIMAEQWAEGELSMSNEAIDTIPFMTSMIPFLAASGGQLDSAKLVTKTVLDAIIATGIASETPLNDLLTSSVAQRKRCPVCTVESEIAETVTAIDLPLNREVQHMSLKESISMLLTGAGEPLCTTCESAHPETESLLRPGKVIVMNVRRLGVSGKKVGTWIHYPLEFDMAEYVPGASGVYRLIGIVHHVGPAAAGRFIGDFLHPDDGKWYRTEDHSVFPFSDATPTLGAPHLGGPSQTSLIYEFTTVSFTTTTTTPAPQRAPLSRLPPMGPVNEASPLFEMGRRGYNNIGNTCYFNVALQILSHSRHLRDLMLPIAANPVPEVGPRVLAIRVLNAFARIVALQWEDSVLGRSSEPINPAELLVALGQFISGAPMLGEMEDAQRASTTLLDAIVTANVDGVSGPVRALFTSVFTKRMTCNTCAGASVVSEDMMALEIPLNPAVERMTLQDSVRMFLADEVVENVFCEACAVNRHKTFSHEVVPAPIVLFNVKRNGFIDGEMGKIGTWIDYPLEFDMAEYIPGGVGRYRLIGIVHHVGGAHGGHFLADFLHADDGRWYRADDREVFPFRDWTPIPGSPHLAGPSQTALLYERI